MNPATATPPKQTMPPADANGELDAANTMLKRFKKAMADLAPPWRQWVIESLQAAYPEDVIDPSFETIEPKK